MRGSDICGMLGGNVGGSWSLLLPRSTLAECVVGWVDGNVDVILGWLLRGWVQRQQSQIVLPLG